MIDARDIRDHTERIWFLGTDLFDEDAPDLRLMDEGVCVHSNAVGHPDFFPGVFYRVPPDEDYFWEYIEKLRNFGYSSDFMGIIHEARRRNYLWIYFHPDIESEDFSELKLHEMTAEELFRLDCNIREVRCVSEEHRNAMRIALNRHGSAGWSAKSDGDERDYWEWLSRRLKEDGDL